MKSVVKKSKIHGEGLFAAIDIVQGETIKSMAGHKVTGDELDSMIGHGLIRVEDDLQINDDSFLILSPDDNLLNHSCDPNAGITHSNILVAIRSINKGEEITIDYSTLAGKSMNINPNARFLFRNEDWRMRCNCKSKSCRKMIGYVNTLPNQAIKRYKLFNALPDFILQQLGPVIILENE